MKILFHVRSLISPEQQAKLSLAEQARFHEVVLMSDFHWRTTKCLPTSYSIREERAIAKIADELGLSQYPDQISVYSNEQPERTLEQLKEQLTAKGLVDSEEIASYMAGQKVEPVEKAVITEEEQSAVFIGSEAGRGTILSPFEIVMTLKQLMPASLIHSIDQGSFFANCGKWDDTVYSFQNVEYLTEFIKKRQTEKTIPDACDIYVSDAGDVCFDFVGNSKREEAKLVQAIAGANRQAALSSSLMAKEDRKFKVVVEIDVVNEDTGQQQSFKIHATYTDSKGRGVIDINPERDINQEEIAALRGWMNECTENLHAFTMTGPAYQVGMSFFANFSIGKFCEDQLHAAALDSLISDFQKLRDKIVRPVALTK